MILCEKYGIMIAVIVSIVIVTRAEPEKFNKQKKRQIYREEVLPHAGGRIPDTAFETDRLFLNRLQKDGISIPDGIVPEQRVPQVYQYPNKNTRTVYRIALSSDARYTPIEGHYHHIDVPAVETTYLFPPIHTPTLQMPRPTYKPTTRAPPLYPVYKQFQLYNPLLNQVRFQQRKKTSGHILDAPSVHLLSSDNAGKSSTSSATKSQPKSYKTISYQNFNLLNTPISAVYGISRRNGHTDTGNNHILDVPNVVRTAAAAPTAATTGSSSSSFHKKLPVKLRIGNGGDDSSDFDNNIFLPQQYETTANLFNEFDRYFNEFDLHDAGSPLQYRSYTSSSSTANGDAVRSSAIATPTASK